MKIAFVGLGNMGGGMAANLVKAGHAVQAFDLSADALARAAENGCTVCATVREAVACGRPAIVDVKVDPAALYSFRRDSFKHRAKA